MPRGRKGITMAVDTEEMVSQTENDATDTENDANETPEENESKRKRVDLTTLDPNDKVILSFFVPAGLRLELRKLAEANEETETNYVRNLIASQVGYTIPDSFNERKHRAGQYSGMSDAEKKAAIAAENKEKRDNVAKLLALVANGGIEASKLAELGIDPSALPKPRKGKDS